MLTPSKSLRAAMLGAAFLLPLVSPLAAQSRATMLPVWPDEGPMTWAPRPTEAAITANDLRTRLYQIADDSMRGRRIGEPGNAKVTAYIAREFERLGLRPAGDGGTWFQSLPYGTFGIDAASARLSVGRGTAPLATEWIPVAPNAANGVAARAALQNVTAIYAGSTTDTAALDPARFRGRIAVFVSGAPGASGGAAPASFVSCADVPNKFGADAVIAFETAQRATPRPAAPARPATPPPSPYRRAIAAGAVGVLVVGLDAMAPATRTAAVAGAGMMRPAATPGADATLAAATIARATAERLFGRPLSDLAIGTTGGRVSGQWTYAWRAAPETHARNVIAMLPGSDPTLAAEYVLVGAHNDHVGANTAPVDHDSLRAVNTVTRRQGANDPACIPTAEQQRRIDSLLAAARRVRPARLDSIFNGADDDGSGTVVLLEIAERFASERPARSILFISHQGEEAGLLGSRWFVDHPTVDLSTIVAAHNMDMLGKGRADQVRFGGPNSVQMLGARRLSREFGDMIDSVNANSAEPMAIDRSWDVTANPLNRFCRSDQVSYVAKNIPVTYFSLGYAQDYHQVTDEPQYIEYEHSARLGRFIHDVMLAIATRPNRPAIAGEDPSYPSCFR
ncbi:MAG: M28 family peptidase [Gemmatimonadota bacterium]